MIHYQGISVITNKTVLLEHEPVNLTFKASRPVTENLRVYYSFTEKFSFFQTLQVQLQLQYLLGTQKQHSLKVGLLTLVIVVTSIISIVCFLTVLLVKRII